MFFLSLNAHPTGRNLTQTIASMLKTAVGAIIDKVHFLEFCPQNHRSHNKHIKTSFLLPVDELKGCSGKQAHDSAWVQSLTSKLIQAWS